MNDLISENIDLSFDAPIAHMMIKGTLNDEDVGTVKAWFDSITEHRDSYDISIEMVKMDFPDLGAARKTFLSVANLLRGLHEADKCAVVTDSAFLRSSAKIEGAVIPGLEMEGFKFEEAAKAESWLEAA